jgi:single-strand DNA-binding protein
MRGLNKVMLIGNLGQDPELKFTQGGTAILNASIACAESYVDRNKERQERTEWVNLVVWGKRGEALNKILSKGSRIFVEGRLQTRSWEANDGTKHYKTEVVASNIVLLDGRQPAAQSAERPPQAQDGTIVNGFEDDIPF